MTSLQEALTEAQSSRRPLLLPGAYDALSARLIEAAGFPAVYVTGAGLANSRLGVPDIGLVTLTELRDQVAFLADAVSIPLVVDADTGFGNAVNVVRTVQLLERAGAAAIQMEDQVSPKKCGHFDGKAVIPASEMAAKVRAAVDTRRSEDLLIIARTDARATSGMSEAIDRALLFREAGADIIFVEAPQSLEELQKIPECIPGPLVANMVEGGRTPLLGARELGDMGFHVVFFANAPLRASQLAMTRVLRHLFETGSTVEVLDQLSTFDERQNAVGKPHFDLLERRYAIEESR